MKTSTLTGMVALMALGSGVWAGENWPQWRGPNHNGSVSAKGLPGTLSRDQIRWAAPVPGKAGATPVIWEDHVFINSPDESGGLVLIAMDRRTGKERWRRAVGLGDKEKGRNNMAAPSPVTDGKTVITLFGTGDLAAFDFEGRPLWSRNLGKDFGRFSVMWIYGSSPLLFEGRLYIQVLQRSPMPADYPLYDGKPERESFLLCVDPATGKDLWRQLRTTDSTLESQESYATPMPMTGPAGKQLVVVGGDHVSAHALADGAEIWRARLYEKRDDWYRIVTTPVIGPGLIYAAGPKGQPVVAIRDGGRGDVTGTREAWRFSENPTDWSTPLLMDGKLFVLDGAKKVLTRLDPVTGERKWSGKLPVREVIWGSPTGADGKIYLHSEEGTVVVCDAGDEFRVLGSITFEGEGPCRGSVAVAQDQVFVRTAKNVYCFGVR
jgi:outer membrane protein assembly factor BamB